MTKFYVTFGQSHPLRHGYVEIHAPSYEAARIEAFEVFGNKFSFIRQTDEIERGGFFPAGRFGEVIDLSHVSE